MLGCFTLSNAEPGAADLMLGRLAGQLTAQGLRVAGAVQVNIDKGADCACDMDLQVLGDSHAPIRISQSLGSGATGCRLDPGALQQVAGRVQARLNAGADLCILPKFGKQEALGLGFRDVIAQALDRDIPVLIHVPADQRAAFDAYAGELAEWLQPAMLADWCHKAVRGNAA